MTAMMASNTVRGGRIAPRRDEIPAYVCKDAFECACCKQPVLIRCAQRNSNKMQK